MAVMMVVWKDHVMVGLLVLREVGLKAGSKAGKTAEQSVGSKVVELADL
jgi:hypothetical protein